MDFKDIEILSISPWIPVDQIPTDRSKIYDSMNEKYGTCGVYQVALAEDLTDIGEDLVHENIGYIGKSKDILSRTYNIRAPKGSHGASRYIRQNELDRSQVKIRYLYTSPDDYSLLEEILHNEMKNQFGYRFKWTEASAGSDGNYSHILDMTRRLTSDEILDIIPSLKEIALAKNQEEFLTRLNEV
jgi:hypothetical protein